MFCKVMVWKGYFCNWLRKNWLTLTSFHQWTTTKHWIPPPFVPPTRISEKIFPLTCLIWNLAPPPPPWQSLFSVLSPSVLLGNWESGCRKFIPRPNNIGKVCIFILPKCCQKFDQVYKMIKVRLSPSKKKFAICFTERPLKIIKIVKVFVLTFWSYRENGFIKKIRLTSKCMTSQPG